jgi:hypothetical protein
MAIEPESGGREEAGSVADDGDVAQPVRPLSEQDVIKTYRYLRIGMMGAVVLLAASIALERSKVDCFQTSISAYYYTPVQAIFVGSMMAVGLSLIVYKGRSWGEDPCLNFAGMLAPVVAIAPTTDVGTCWSVPPTSRPITDDGSLAPWVGTNVDNNFTALLIAGVFGLIVAAFLLVVTKRRPRAVRDALEKEPRTSRTLVGTFIVLVVAWWLSENWSDFYTRAHGFAAVGMFILLIGAITAVAWGHRQKGDRVWFRRYTVVAVLMAVGGILIWLTRIFGDHTVFALEGYEIALFALYWVLQTKENWSEEVQVGQSTPPQLLEAEVVTQQVHRPGVPNGTA